MLLSAIALHSLTICHLEGRGAGGLKTVFETSHPDIEVEGCYLLLENLPRF